MEDKLSGTTFAFELAKSMQKIIPIHIEACRLNKGLRYHEYGTKEEKSLKQIVSYYSNIVSVLKEIDIVINFLEKNRHSILIDYPFLESQETFYRYHFENYYIRLITTLDLVGKIGTIVYNFELNLERVNAYTFKDKARKEGFEEIANTTEKLISKLSLLKDERNKKLHTGESEIDPLEGVILWEDLHAWLGQETDEILKEDADEKIKERINLLRSDTEEYIELIIEFLETSKGQLLQLIAVAKNS